MYVLAASRAEARMNWLNRLRSAKGFPVDPGLKMEDFLNSSRSPDRSSALSCGEISENGQVKIENKNGDVRGDVQEGYLPPNSNDGFANGEKKVRAPVRGTRKKKSLATVKEEKKDWLEKTNSALAELFCMRQEPRMWKFDDRKEMKHRRKQEKPRICPCVDANLTPQLSGDNDNSVEKPVKISDNTRFTSSPLSAVNSVVVGVAKKVSDREISPVKKRKGFRQIVEDSIDRSNRTNADLSSSSCYPCTEVTVIDTSVPICRSRKVMYSKAQSVSDQCTALDELLPTRKSPNSATSPSLRTVVDNNAANCSASIQIQTRGAHDFNNRSSSKD